MDFIDKEDLDFYKKHKYDISHTEKKLFFTNIGIYNNKPCIIKNLMQMKVNDSINDEFINIFWTSKLKYLDLSDCSYQDYFGEKLTFFENLRTLIIPFSYMFHSLTNYPMTLQTLIIKMPNDSLVRLKYTSSFLSLQNFRNLPINLKKIIFLIDDGNDATYITNFQEILQNELIKCKLPFNCCIYVNNIIL